MTLLLAALAGALIGVAGALIASYRTAAQPSGADPVAEITLIEAVLDEPARYRLSVAVSGDDFAWEPNGVLWDAIASHAVVDDSPEHVAEATRHKVASLTIKLTSEELLAAITDSGELEEADLGIDPTRTVSEKEFTAAGTAVLTSSEARELTGSAPLTVGDRPEQALYRERTAPSLGRIITSAVLAAAGMAIVAAAEPNLIGLIAAGVLVAGSVVTALVDVDTMYVDMPTVLLIAVFGGGAAALSASIDGTLSENALYAAVTTVSIVGSLLAVAFIWKKLRKLDGLGGGDGYILIPLVAIPVLVTGSPEAGLWGLLVSLLFTVFGQIGLIIAGRSTRNSQFAWIPYLVTGWPIGWYFAVTYGVM